jgi:hypothetical protein
MEGNIIDALSFGSPPSSQQALQIGEAAGVAAPLDVMKQMPSAAVPVLPALGKERFKVHGEVGLEAARSLSGGALNLNHFATLRRSWPVRRAISL